MTFLYPPDNDMSLETAGVVSWKFRPWFNEYAALPVF